MTDTYIASEQQQKQEQQLSGGIDLRLRCR